MESLLELSRGVRRGLDDAGHIRAISSDLLRELDLEPPISLKVVAAMQAINSIEQVLGLDCPGCLLMAGEAGWTIKLRATDPPGRQRFTGFHEVGHTFLPGFALHNHFRCFPDPRLALDSPDIEALSDVAAVELLLPETFFRPDAASSDFSWETVDDLAARYGASREATARRFVALWPEPAFVMALAVCNKTTDPPGAKPRLRLQSHVPGGPAWAPMFKLKSLSDGDPLSALTVDDRYYGPSALSGLQPSNLGRSFHVDARKSEWVDTQTGEVRHRILAMARSTTLTQ